VNCGWGFGLTFREPEVDGCRRRIRAGAAAELLSGEESGRGASSGGVRCAVAVWDVDAARG